MGLLTTDVTMLGDGQGTRYRAELNIKLLGLDTMTPEEVKKTIDTVTTDPATASAVKSKTLKLGISPDEGEEIARQPRQDRIRYSNTLHPAAEAAAYVFESA